MSMAKKRELDSLRKEQQRILDTARAQAVKGLPVSRKKSRTEREAAQHMQDL